jgi:N-acetyl-gamma-glutamyl-phosphate reductase
MNDREFVSAAVLGATGYVGRELIRLLAGHPRIRIAAASSEGAAGTPLRALVPSAPAITLQRAEEVPLGECQVAFVCLPHGEAAAWSERAYAAGAMVVDLSQDLRVAAARPEWAEQAGYGLPELHRERIREARLVANPGCYPTAALLALAPLLRRGLVAGPVIIDAASGVTGAGRTPRADLLFAEVAENFLAYAVGNTHRHLAEMRDQAGALGGGAEPELVFTPHLLPVRRGILETIYVPLGERLAEPAAPWREDYEGEPFVEVLETRLPTLQDVVGTNRVAVGVREVDGVSTPLLIVVAAIDNLLKGAAGQAVQNLNLMSGWPETEGLL